MHIKITSANNGLLSYPVTKKQTFNTGKMILLCMNGLRFDRMMGSLFRRGVDLRPSGAMAQIGQCNCHTWSNNFQVKERAQSHLEPILMGLALAEKRLKSAIGEQFSLEVRVGILK